MDISPPLETNPECDLGTAGRYNEGPMTPFIEGAQEDRALKRTSTVFSVLDTHKEIFSALPSLEGVSIGMEGGKGDPAVRRIDIHVYQDSVYMSITMVMETSF